MESRKRVHPAGRTLRIDSGRLLPQVPSQCHAQPQMDAQHRDHEAKPLCCPTAEGDGALSPSQALQLPLSKRHACIPPAVRMRLLLDSAAEQWQQQQQQQRTPRAISHISMAEAALVTKAVLLFAAAAGACRRWSKHPQRHRTASEGNAGSVRITAASSSPSTAATAPASSPSAACGSPRAQGPGGERHQGPQGPGGEEEEEVKQRLGRLAGAGGASGQRQTAPRGGMAAGGSPGGGCASLRPALRRSRVLVKVPSDDSRGLPHVPLHELQARLHAAAPSLHAQRLSVRRGCIILELDVAEVQRASGPRTEGSSSSSLLSDAEWLELLNVRDIAADEMGNVPAVVSVFMNGQVTQLEYSAETSRWVRTPGSFAALQLQPQCVTLDSRMARISLQGRGLAAGRNRVEAVSAGRPLPCTVVSRSVGAGDQDVVVLEVDFSSARPGLAHCNVWGRMEPVSCLVATLPVLLLPSGCAEAAAQMNWVLAAAENTSAVDALLDLGELLNVTPVLGGQPSTSASEGQQSSLMAQQQQQQPSAECLIELAATAANILSWCQQSGYIALAQVVVNAADRLDHLINPEPRDSLADNAGTAAVQIGSRAHAADAGAAGAEPRSSNNPAAAQPDAAARQPEPGWSVRSCWAALQRLDTAPNIGSAQLCSSALPTRMWASFILFVYLLGIFRCVASGQCFRDTIALVFIALPYAAILASHVTGAADGAGRGGSSAGGGGGARAAPAQAGAGGGSAGSATRMHLAWWLARNSRLCLHVYRSLLSALMGLGYLPIPLVVKLSLARPMAGIAYPLKMLYMVMEAYDWRAATLCLIFVDTPATYLLLGNQNVPYARKHLATLGWMASTVQWLMSCLHACLQSSAARAARAGQ